MINRIVLDQDILAGPVFKRFGAGAGLEADTVVTHVDRTAAHDHALALHDVDAVAVLRIPGAADGHAVDRHVGAVRGDQVEFRGVLDGHARDKHARAVGETHQMGPHFLLIQIRRDQIGEMFQAMGIPERAVFGDGPAHLQEFLPLDIADLAAFDRAPPGAVAVDDARAGNAHVVALGGGNARAYLSLLKEIPLVRRQQDDGTPLQMQVDAVFQHDGAGQENAFGNNQVAAALLRKGGDGLAESLGIGTDAIADTSVIQQGYGPVGDLDGCG